MQGNLFSSNVAAQQLKAKYEATFKSFYTGLNTKQRTAVDLIDGPVMVVAGPGTGKTQILATRIGKIIFEEQVDSSNILCLTFTDAATIAMRRRLIKIIGPEAHKVNIFTFHGFCNQIIQDNLNYFGNYRQLEKLSDLEQIDLYNDIINNHIDDKSPLKRLKGDNNFEANRMKHLFSFMSKEVISVKEVHDAIDEYIQTCKEDTENGDFFYKRKYKEFQKGDPKPKAFLDLEWRMTELRDASAAYDEYIKLKKEMGRYTYDDMILWVLKAFKDNELLLAQYQERFQYFLVDEYQDTNGSQNQLLDNLVGFWGDQANVFVVGDDDQAIYKFQGANLSNIEDFQKSYKPQLVVLEENYRSSQNILDVSQSLIELNNVRLVNNKELELSKSLIASGNNKALSNLPSVMAFDNDAQEQAYYVEMIADKHQRNERIDNIAILYRNHAQVEQIVSVLDKKGVPLNVRRKLNILEMPLVRNIFMILEYIQSALDTTSERQDLLVKILHFKFFGLKAKDIAQMALHLSEESKKTKEFKEFNWRLYFSEAKNVDQLDLEKPEAVKNIFTIIDGWITGIHNDTLQVLFGKILNEGRILQYVFNQPDKSWQLQVLNSLFDLIKEESNKEPDLQLLAFLEMIGKLKSNDISVDLRKIIHSDKGINFITAHSAKGLEFDQVYIIGCTKNIWDAKKRKGKQYTFPPELMKDDVDIEDERRLFFVAMTRAETQLNMSFAKAKIEGKELSKCQFLDEILATSKVAVVEKSVDEATIKEFQYYSLLNTKKRIELIDKQKVNSKLANYKLSVTHLNKYLKCPLTFYFETILQVPTARTKYMGFGNAIHHALEQYYIALDSGQATNKELLIQHFVKGIGRSHSHFTKEERQKMTTYGKQVLGSYYDENLKLMKVADSYKMEHKVKNAEYKGIPVKGVLDRIDEYKDYIVVHDYKTGDPEKPKTKANLRPPDQRNTDGGEYWRQMVFYRILTDSDATLPKMMTHGYMDFVEPNVKSKAFTSHKYVISQDDIDLVGNQIVETMEKIKNHEFNIQCEDEYCRWCDFVRNDFVLSLDDTHDEQELNDFLTPDPEVL